VKLSARALSSEESLADPLENAASLIWSATPPKLQALLSKTRETQAALLKDLETASSGLGASGGRELAVLTELVEMQDEVKTLSNELEGLAEMIEDEDKDVAELAKHEFLDLEEKRRAIGSELLRRLLARAEATTGDDREAEGEASDCGDGAIVEVRAGTGGDEASLFAYELMGLYQKFARAQGWSVEVMSMDTGGGDIGGLKGLKEGVIAIKGDDCFTKLRFESGVHRVQRVPVNDVKLQTSAATVAVLQDSGTDSSIGPGAEFSPSELRIDVYRASGAGGQHVNTTESAVRITHLATGVVVAIQDERSQHQNKAKALRLLGARIKDAQRAATAAKRSAEVKDLVGSGDRSERIRTYNFPQDRVTDHRLGSKGTMHGVISLLKAEAGGEALGELLGNLEKMHLTSKLEVLLK